MISIDHESLYITILLTSAHNVFGFWGHFYFYLIDRYSWLQQYKINKQKKPESELVNSAFNQYLFDSFVVFPLLSYFIVAPYLKTCMTKIFPSILQIIYQLIICFFFTDFLFYWFHRTLHTKWLYSTIHKQHHEFSTVSSISSEFSNILESISNILSVFIPPTIFQCHLIIYLFLIILRLWESQDAHCGYEFPYYLSPWSLLRSTRMHDYHHSKNIGAYGMFGIWDYLCGTNSHYYEWRRKEMKKNINTSS